jgi:hypothetical protein
MDIIRDIIYEQNYDLLQKIANDKFNDDQQKIDFIKKYHKKHFSYMKPITKNIIPQYATDIYHCVKKL